MLRWILFVRADRVGKRANVYIVLAESPVFLQKSPISPPISHIFLQQSPVSQHKEPDTPVMCGQKPYISAKEPYVSAKEPCISTKELCMPAQRALTDTWHIKQARANMRPPLCM